jgi:phage-related baseplate assembly protein
MDNTELHYLTYDPQAIWDEMHQAYVEAGGDILYPGDEKEILLRSVLAVLTQAFAGIDNALRMQTLRYAVGDYLDVLGEQRGCARIQANAAVATVQISFKASCNARTIPAGTTMTADVEQTGYVQTINTQVRCTEAGSAGNGLLAMTAMQFTVINTAVTSILVTTDAFGGEEREDDDTYRERIRLYGLTSVTTGPASQYESAAMSVTSEILDAKAVNLGGGSVGVFLILSSDTGASAILSAVEAALSADNVRPLTDTVTVSQAAAIVYTLNVKYTAILGSNISSALAAAVSDYQDWQDNKIGQAFNPDRLMSMLYQAGATRVVWGEGSAFNGGTVEYTAIDEKRHCKGSITLEVYTP